MKKEQYTQKDIKVLSRESIYQGFVKLEKVSIQYRLFNQDKFSKVVERELIHRKKAAGVLIYNDEQKRFALIEQFRIGAIEDTRTPWHLEIIAGVLDGDESPEECIYRESIEEASCKLYDLEHLFTFYPSAGSCDELLYLYTAQADFPESGSIFGLAEEGENIKLHLFDYSQVQDLFLNEQLRNAPVIIALQWLKQHIQALQN